MKKVEMWQAEWIRRIFLTFSLDEPVYERQQVLTHKTLTETSIVCARFPIAAQGVSKDHVRFVEELLSHGPEKMIMTYKVRDAPLSE